MIAMFINNEIKIIIIIIFKKQLRYGSMYRDINITQHLTRARVVCCKNPINLLFKGKLFTVFFLP